MQHSKKNNQHGNSEADWRNPVGFFHASPLYIVSHPKRTANLRLWKARFGCLRGIGEGRFHGDLSGSDKHYSFVLPACVENPAVHLCESAIDVMSYATLCKLDGIDWRRHNLLSLAGIYQPKKVLAESKLPVALTRFLEDHPSVKTIYLHLDNDGPGRLATKAIMTVIPEEYEVKNRPPPTGKDVNDTLCHRLGIPIRCSNGKELER